MEKIKIGVIGVGSISQAHIEPYLENPNVELYAFCDINRKRLEEMGKRYGITRLFESEEEMLQKLPELDAVSVCVWNSNHAPCSIMALEAGKHVLCEKPMAYSTADAVKMLETAKRTGKHLQIGFVCRYGRDAVLIEELRDKGFFGDIYYAKAAYLRRHGNPGGWFCNQAFSAGGPMIDLGVHVLDLTRFLMGNPRPVSVYGAAFEKLHGRPGCKDRVEYTSNGAGADDICDVEDLATALVRYENGAVLQIETSYDLNLKEDLYSVQLFGDKGGVRIAPDLELYTDINGYMMNVTPADRDYYMDESRLFYDEIDHFVDCVMHNTPCRAPAEDGVEIMRILEAIYESARTGHEVIL